jgi:hypothetical protein
MFITKMALPRRTFLRGMGATLALPLLDAMIPALSAAKETTASSVRRLGFVYIPNGVAMNSNMNLWKPATVGKDFEFSPILASLEPFRKHTVVVSGLSHAQAEAMCDGNGDHTRGVATWLNGVHPRHTEGADVLAGTTIDQMAALKLGKDTPLPSLELGLDTNLEVGNCENGYSCLYRNNLSWRSPTTPLAPEGNPRVVFERLFGDGGTSAQRLAQMRKTRSILDSVLSEMTNLKRSLGTTDNAIVTEYFDAVREVERRIQMAEKHNGESAILELERPPSVPAKFEEHARMMFDLQCLAYQADITRVFTLMMGRESSARPFPEIGVPEAHHGLSHHRDDPETIVKYAKLNAYETQQVAYFLEKLSSTPDGDGSLLDHTLLLYGAGLSNPNEHAHIDLPLVLLGGANGQLKGGRHLQYSIDTPMTNLLLSMLDKVDVPVESLGDSTGRLDLDRLSGI